MVYYILHQSHYMKEVLLTQNMKITTLQSLIALHRLQFYYDVEEFA